MIDMPVLQSLTSTGSGLATTTPLAPPFYPNIVTSGSKKIRLPHAASELASTQTDDITARGRGLGLPVDLLLFLTPALGAAR